MLARWISVIIRGNEFDIGVPLRTVLNQGTNKEMNMNIVFSVTYWHKADLYDKKESQNQKQASPPCSNPRAQQILFLLIA